jgi:hypothetical protein
MSARGELLSRIVPKGATGDAYKAAVAEAEADSGESLDVFEQFPAIIGDRFRKNRGFEDVAAQRFNGRTYVYTALQSPMENPNTTTRNSLAIRVFRIDVTRVDKPVVDREWAALLDIKPGKKSPLADKVLGAVAGRCRQAPHRGARRHDLQRSGRVDQDLQARLLEGDEPARRRLRRPSHEPHARAAVHPDHRRRRRVGSGEHHPNPTTIDFVPLPAACT